MGCACDAKITVLLSENSVDPGLRDGVLPLDGPTSESALSERDLRVATRGTTRLDSRFRCCRLVFVDTSLPAISGTTPLLSAELMERLRG
jgi:hypothetical protein